MSLTAEDKTSNRLQGFAGDVINAVYEIIRLFPDSALFGSLVLYLITQHMPYGVFSLFLLEASAFYKSINLVMDGVTERPAIKRPADDPKEREDFKRCRSGFLAPRLEAERLFMHEGIISMPLFYMAATAAYLLSATFEFAPVLQTMGANWSSRVLFSVICAIFIMTMCYIRVIGCSSHLSLIGALLLGGMGGVFFWYINSRVFGSESMNFSGLPYLSDKGDTGSPLYTCVPSSMGA